jgi:microcystin-dependent protein
MTVDFKQSVNIWSAGMMVRMLGVNPVPTTIGYRAANGVALSRTAVDVLFGAIGTTFGVGDGSTTYNPPNRAAENNLNWFIYAQD